MPVVRQRSSGPGLRNAMSTADQEFQIGMWRRGDSAGLAILENFETILIWKVHTKLTCKLLILIKVYNTHTPILIVYKSSHKG